MAGTKPASTGVKPFVERLAEGVVVCDGAMGTMLYARGVFLNRCFDELNLSSPDLVRSVHADYLEAGADVVETNTFGAHRLKLGPHGLESQVRKINGEGARLAREAAEGRGLVAGAIGPIGKPLAAHRQHRLRGRGRGLSRAGRGPGRRGSRPLPDRDHALARPGAGGVRGGARRWTRACP